MRDIAGRGDVVGDSPARGKPISDGNDLVDATRVAFESDLVRIKAFESTSIISTLFLLWADILALRHLVEGTMIATANARAMATGTHPDG